MIRMHARWHLDEGDLSLIMLRAWCSLKTAPTSRSGSVTSLLIDHDTDVGALQAGRGGTRVDRFSRSREACRERVKAEGEAARDRVARRLAGRRVRDT